MIDGGYLDKVRKYCFPNHNIDFLKLAIELCHGTKPTKMYYYYCPWHMDAPPTQEQLTQSEKQERFLQYLKSIGYNLRKGYLVEVSPGQFKQKGVDTLIAADLSSMAGNETEFRLLTGDGDFVPVVEDSLKRGVSFVLWYKTCSDRQTREPKTLLAKTYKSLQSQYPQLFEIRQLDWSLIQRCIP